MSDISKVTVTDINMNFGSMVWFMIKWAFASIIAAFVVGIPILILAFMLELFKR